jgi:hypothetical protein
MDAGEWHIEGLQLDMFAGLEGDGDGTLDLLDAADEASAKPWPWTSAPEFQTAEWLEG